MKVMNSVSPLARDISHLHDKKASRMKCTKEWTCPICNRTFRSPSTSTFRRHERIHVRDDTDQGICDICDTKFLSREALRRHFRRRVCYNFETGERRYVARRYIAGREHYVNAEFRCSQCSVACQNEESLQEHVIRIHEEKVEWNVDGPPFVCQVCGWDFDRFLAYRRHIKSHEAGRFDCRVCRKKFKDRDSLVEHIQNVACSHVHKCPLCDLEYGSKLQRDKHLNNEHKHLCPLCGEKFAGFGVLQKHLRTHEPKICKICGFTAKSANQVKKHEQTHENNRHWFCDLCGAGFTAESSRNRHMHMKKCSRAASRNKLLPFRCMVCGTHISTKEILIKHLMAKHEMKVDADSIPVFTCNECGVEFGRVEIFNVHVQRDHGVASDILKPEPLAQETSPLDVSMNNTSSDTSVVLDEGQQQINIMDHIPVYTYDRGEIEHMGGEIEHMGGEIEHMGGEVEHMGGEVEHMGGEVQHMGGEVRHMGGEVEHIGGRMAGGADAVPPEDRHWMSIKHEQVDPDF